MKRREFFNKSALATGGLLFIPSFLQALEQSTITTTNKKLIIIQLKGGNDGLNTIVPFENSTYYNLRNKIAIPKSEILPLNESLGMNKSLISLYDLYNKGYVSIINNVGYPNPNRSHFRSSDIWHSASHSNQTLQTGWIGRYLDRYNKKPHEAIEINNSLSLLLKGEIHNGLALNNAKMFVKTFNSPLMKQTLESARSEHLNEHNLGYLYNTLIKTESSAAYIAERQKLQKKDTYNYPNNPLANQLKNIAQFIHSGLDTQVYFASLSGFDTHVNQTNTHSRLLKIFADSSAAFVKDLEKHELFKNVTILVFSEFGRRVKQNAGNGTDHGTANNVFIIDKNLRQAGLFNKLASLDHLDKNGDLKFTIDFRNIYADILKNCLESSNKNIIPSNFYDLGIL